MRVSLLTVAPHHSAIVELVLTKEPLWVVVGVDVDLGQGVVGSGLFHAFVDTGLQPGQQQLEPAGHQCGGVR